MYVSVIRVGHGTPVVPLVTTIPVVPLVTTMTKRRVGEFTTDPVRVMPHDGLRVET